MKYTLQVRIDGRVFCTHVTVVFPRQSPAEFDLERCRGCGGDSTVHHAYLGKRSWGNVKDH